MFQVEKLVLVLSFVSSVLSAGTVFKCEVPGQNISEYGHTKNSAIYNTTQKCRKQSNIPALCLFSFVNCKEEDSESNFACQLNGSPMIFTQTGASEREAKKNAIAACKKDYYTPALCEHLGMSCLDLTR